MEILNQIQADILNQATSLSTTLRKAKVLGYQLQLVELSNWVSLELAGYKSKNELPDYRVLQRGCYGKWTNLYWTISNYAVPLSQIKDEKLKELLTTYYVFNGIRSMEALVSGEKQHFLVSTVVRDLVNHYIGKDGYQFAEIEYAVDLSDLEQILDTVRNRLLDFVLKLDKDWRIENEPPPIDTLKNLVSVIIYNQPGGNMSVFDQRNQKVNYQYNAAGDINFNAVQSRLDVALELQKLEAEVKKAAQAGALSEEAAIDVESKIKKAVIQAQKPEPDKKTTLDYLNEAKALIEGVASAAGLVSALSQASEIIRRLF